MAKPIRKKGSPEKSCKEIKVIETHESPAVVKGAEPHKNLKERGTPLIEMRNISIAFGGIKAVDHASLICTPVKWWACSATMVRASPR